MIGLVRNEWKKVFLPVLLTTVLLAIAMSVLSCTIYQNYVLHYDLEAWEVGTELFSLLYPLFVVVPLCWNLYYERKNNFLLYVMPRVKIKKYLTAKWIAYALGTLCIIVIPYILSAVFALYVKPPVVPFVENPFIGEGDSICEISHELVLDNWQSVPHTIPQECPFRRQIIRQRRKAVRRR